MTVTIVVNVRRALPSLSRVALTFEFSKVTGPTPTPSVPLLPEVALSAAGRSYFKEPQVRGTKPDLER